MDAFEAWTAKHGVLYWVAVIVAASVLAGVPGLGPLLFLGAIGGGVWWQLRSRRRRRGQVTARRAPAPLPGPAPTPVQRFTAPPSPVPPAPQPAPQPVRGFVPPAPPPPPPPMPVTPPPPQPRPDLGVPVAGIGHHRGWGRTRGAAQVTLVREPSNPHDPNAVAIFLRSTQIGYIPRERAALVAPIMDQLRQPRAAAMGYFTDHSATVTIPDLLAPSLAPRLNLNDLEPVAPWGRLSNEFEVAFESQHRDEIAAVFRTADLVITPEGVELKQALAHLMPSGNAGAPAVLVEGQWVGNLTDPQALPHINKIQELAAHGEVIEVAARVWACNDYGTIRSRVQIKLPNLNELRAPGPMPTGAHVLLPRGSYLQVTGEEAYLNEVSALLAGSPEQPVVATLHIAAATSRSAKPRVEVRVYGDVVGQLTPYMSEHFLALIKACDEEGVTVVCHAAVKGNQLKADVVLDTVKAGDLSDDWIRQHIYETALGARVDEVLDGAELDDLRAEQAPPSSRPDFEF